MGSMRDQDIGGKLQVIYIYEFLWICCNFFIHSKITLLGGKIWVKFVIFSGRCLTNFPSAKSIHIWHLPLNTIEWLAKSEVFENTWIFVKICIFVKFHKQFTKNQRNYISQKLSIHHFLPNFSRKVIFFTLFYCFFTFTVWLNRLQNLAKTSKNWTHFQGEQLPKQNFEVQTVNWSNTVLNFENLQCSRSLNIFYRTTKIMVPS